MKGAKNAFKAAAAALLLAGLAACQGSAPEEEKPERPTVGVLLWRTDDAYIALVGQALEQELSSDAFVIVLGANGDQLTQNEQFSDLISKKVDALAVNIVDAMLASDFVDQARKAGIPLVFFNREPDLNLLKTYPKTCFVGTVPQDAGKMQGGLIKALWDRHPEYDRNHDGAFQYVMFQGNPENPEAIARTEYSIRQARDLGMDMRQVGETYVCDWDQALATASMRMALDAHGDVIELVVSNNDAMALGAIAALAERGWNTTENPGKFIPVVGVDAIPAAEEAIRQGVMSATVKQDDEGMAAAVSALVLNAINGRPFLEGTAYTWDASGIAVRIPYAPFEGDK